MDPQPFIIDGFISQKFKMKQLRDSSHKLMNTLPAKTGVPKPIKEKMLKRPTFVTQANNTRTINNIAQALLVVTNVAAVTVSESSLTRKNILGEELQKDNDSHPRSKHLVKPKIPSVTSPIGSPNDHPGDKGEYFAYSPFKLAKMSSFNPGSITSEAMIRLPKIMAAKYKAYANIDSPLYEKVIETAKRSAIIIYSLHKKRIDAEIAAKVNYAHMHNHIPVDLIEKLAAQKGIDGAKNRLRLKSRLITETWVNC